MGNEWKASLEEANLFNEQEKTLCAAFSSFPFFGFPGDTSIPSSPVAVQMRRRSFYRETLVILDMFFLSAFSKQAPVFSYA
jgi:hypothetical protein